MIAAFRFSGRLFQPSVVQRKRNAVSGETPLKNSHSQTWIPTTDQIRLFYSDQWQLLEFPERINFTERGAKLLALLQKEPSHFTGKRVLVAGCGYGWETVLFHKWGADVTGVDLYIEAAESLLKRWGFGGIRLIQANLETFQAVESFDYIYCNGILHHTPDPS